VQAAHKRRKRVATNDEAESEGDESSDEQDNAEDAESRYVLTKSLVLIGALLAIGLKLASHWPA
jgi:hypothetical protein